MKKILPDEGDRRPIGEVSAATAGILRDRVINGTWEPGAKLPKRSALAAELGVSNDSLQRAIDALVEDGFLAARRCLGTQVVPRPPHLFHFGLALEAVPGAEHWSQFFDSLEAAVAEINDYGLVRWSVYRGMGTPGESEGFRRLRQDVLGRRLAGLVTALHSHDLVDTLPFAQAGVPVTKVMGALGPQVPAQAGAQLSAETFMEQAIGRLLAAGCQRIAVVALARPGDWRLRIVQQAFHRYNLPWRTEWLQGVGSHAPEWGENLMHLLFKHDGRELPDGLVVTDDNLVPGIWAGLQSTGTKVPAEVKVVAHFNYPSRAACDAPFAWLGYDHRHLLLRAMCVLRAAAAAATSDWGIAAVWRAELETPAAFRERLADFCAQTRLPGGGRNVSGPDSTRKSPSRRPAKAGLTKRSRHQQVSG